MRTHRLSCSRAAGLVSAVLLIVTLHAQSSAQAPTRDTSVGRGGSGRIRGRVVALESGAPLRRATVRLTPPAGAAAQGRGMPVLAAAGRGGFIVDGSSPVVATDGEGRFEFSGLAPGRYTLTASKGGYITLSYGERRLREGGRPIDLGAGETIERVDFTLPKGGVIAAHVTDDAGEPLNGIIVEAMQYRFVDGERRLIAISGASTLAGLASTNEAGEQRLHGLPPGDYVVVAGLNAQSRFTLAGTQMRAYLATYYPNGLSAPEAQPVRVIAGQDVAVEIPMRMGRFNRIAGRVVRSDGSPFVPSAMWLRRDAGSGSTNVSIGFLQDGTFAMPRILPGDYTLEIMPEGQSPEFARLPLRLNGDLANDIVVTTRPVTPVRGRVVFDATAASLRPGQVTPTVEFSPPSAGRSSTPMFRVSWPSDQPAPPDGWTFDMIAVGTGVFRMRSSSGWFLKQVVLDGRDVTDVPVDFDTVGSREFQIVVTQKRSEVSGTVTDASNSAISEYVVVLFPENREQWRSFMRLSGTGRADQAGRFRIGGLPAGRYLAAALESIEMGEERDPDLLGRLTERATPIVLGEGESKTITLTLQR